MLVLCREQTCTDNVEMLPVPRNRSSDDSSSDSEPDTKRAKLENNTMDEYVKHRLCLLLFQIG